MATSRIKTTSRTGAPRRAMTSLRRRKRRRRRTRTRRVKERERKGHEVK